MLESAEAVRTGRSYRPHRLIPPKIVSVLKPFVAVYLSKLQAATCTAGVWEQTSTVISKLDRNKVSTQKSMSLSTSISAHTHNALHVCFLLHQNCKRQQTMHITFQPSHQPDSPSFSVTVDLTKPDGLLMHAKPAYCKSWACTVVDGTSHRQQTSGGKAVIARPH
jgi:hypothetical protein